MTDTLISAEEFLAANAPKWMEDMALDLANRPHIRGPLEAACRLMQQAAEATAGDDHAQPLPIPLHTWRCVGKAALPAIDRILDELVAGFVSLVVFMNGKTLAANLVKDVVLVLAFEIVRSARWAHYNFPSVRLTPVQACALALSDMTDEQLSDVAAPWPTFVVLSGDAFVANGAEVHHTFISKLSNLSTGSGPHPWNVGVYFSDSVVTTRTVESAHEAFHDEILFSPGGVVADTTAVSRAALLATRTALNVCEVLQSGQATLRRATRKTQNKKGKPITGQGLAYSLGLPVHVDMREHVQDYLSAKVGHACKVRWVVRGHHRQQAHGPGLTLRKRMWIEPHWKGPERGPMLIREHQIHNSLVGLPQDEDA